jgi:hypothetical protein
VYRDPYKLVVSSTGTRLFDLSNDPAESHDVAPSRPAVVAELAAALPPWSEAGPEDVEPEAGPEDVGESSLSAQEQDEIARQLAALGYLE